MEVTDKPQMDTPDRPESEVQTETEIPEINGDAGVEPPDAAAPAAMPESSAIALQLADLEKAVRGLQDSLDAGLAKVGEYIDAAAKQVAFVPRQVLSIDRKIADLTTSISEPRYRALLEDVVRIHDLVDQLLRGCADVSDNTPSADRRNYSVLKTQLMQILRVNGLSEIDATGKFDSKWHRAMARTPTQDPALDGQIARVIRPGFRTEGEIALRFAEVDVYAFEQNESRTLNIASREGLS